MAQVLLSLTYQDHGAPGSNVKRAMTEILFDQGFILNYKFQDDDKQGIITIALKYNQSTKVPAITKIQRASEK